jgi:hypothetical protein
MDPNSLVNPGNGTWEDDRVAVVGTAVIPILLEWVDERSAVVGVSRREILLVPTGTVVGTAGGMAVGSAAIPTLRAASSLLHEPAYR